MNKQELIKKYKEYENGLFDIGAKAACQLFLKDLEQLDETQKVKVPQFVADWYEEHKYNLEFSIFDYVYRFDQEKKSDFKDWFDELKTESFQTLVNMHQFGYEVEKEKRYLVKVKGMLKGFEFLTFKFGHVWIFSSEEEDEEFRLHHTRKELEKSGFGWVFDCPGIDIEEVED